MHGKDDNVGVSLTGYDAEEVRKGLLKGTCAVFIALNLIEGGLVDLILELLELGLLAIFGSKQTFNLICRVIKRIR